MVKFFLGHGTVTYLANKYKVCRPFIYEIKKEFLEICKTPSSCVVREHILEKEQKIKKQILSLRLECKSPIEGISSYLSRFEEKCSSVGYISELLKDIGSKLPNVQSFEGSVIRVVLCSDEVFSKGKAILITVDPQSLAILSIELSEGRQGEDWKTHWSRLLSEGYEPLLLCNDEGTGMAKAHQTLFPNLGRQSDTFHAISHRLGLFEERFLKAAYSAIDKLYECERLLNNSKTKDTWDKRFSTYVQKEVLCSKAIQLSEHFTFLYHCLLEQLQLFDNQGDLKEIAQVVADFDTALDYLTGLGQVEISKQVKTIIACKNELFLFRQNAKLILDELRHQVPQPILQTLSLAWQAHKNSINAKNTVRKNTLKRKEKHLLDSFLITEQDQAKSGFKELVYTQLDQIVQSSAAVECINSILRPYLDASKNQVTQEALNLFMAYHNHRRFKHGKRKGKTPYELLTGTVQHNDWIDIILQATT